MIAPLANEPPMRVYVQSPAEVAEWAKWEDRVNCADCRNRSGPMCAVFKRSHVPLDLVHRCDSFSRRKR